MVLMCTPAVQLASPDVTGGLRVFIEAGAEGVLAPTKYRPCPGFTLSPCSIDKPQTELGLNYGWTHVSMQIYENYQSYRKGADQYPALNSALIQMLCHHSLL